MYSPLLRNRKHRIIVTLIVLLALCIGGLDPGALAQNTVRPVPPQTPQVVSELQQQLRRANLLERQGQLEAASAVYRRLYEEYPGNDQIYQRYRDVLIRMGDYDMAEYLITEHLKNAPHDLTSLVRLGTIYYHQNDKEKAIRQWQSILESLGKTPRTYQQVISTMLGNGLLRESTELITEARTILEQPGFFSMQLASLYTSRMDYKQATEEYLLYYLHRSKRDENFLVSQLSQFPDEPEVHTQVKQVLHQAIEDHPSDEKLRKVLADYLYRIREYDAALAQYQKLEATENVPGKHRLAVAHHLLSDGEYDYALQLYKSLLKNSNLPKYELLLGYAEAGYRQMLNRYSQTRPEMTFSQNTLWEIDFIIIPEEAGSELSQIVSDYQSVSEMVPHTPAGMIAKYRLGELYLRLGNDFDRALEHFSHCAADSGHPRQAEALMNIGYCYLAKGNLRAARDHWQTAVSSLPNQKNSLRNNMLLQIAGTYLYEGSLSQGIAQLRQVQDSTRISSELYNDILEVQTLISEGLKNKSASDSTTLRQFFRAEFYVKQHKISEAQKAHLRVLDLKNTAPIAPYSLLRTAQLGRLLHQTPQVIDWLTRIINNYADSKLSDQAIFMLAELQKEQGNYDDAIRWYEKILVDYPSSILEQKARQTIRELQAQTS